DVRIACLLLIIRRSSLVGGVVAEGFVRGAGFIRLKLEIWLNLPVSGPYLDSCFSDIRVIGNLPEMHTAGAPHGRPELRRSNQCFLLGSYPEFRNPQRPPGLVFCQ